MILCALSLAGYVAYALWANYLQQPSLISGCGLVSGPFQEQACWRFPTTNFRGALWPSSDQPWFRFVLGADERQFRWRIPASPAVVAAIGHQEQRTFGLDPMHESDELETYVIENRRFQLPKSEVDYWFSVFRSEPSTLVVYMTVDESKEQEAIFGYTVF